MNTTTTPRGITTTTIEVRSYGRIDAMRKAEEKARTTAPEAVAVAAVMSAGTTKAERASIERHPELRRWDVTIHTSTREGLIREFGEQGRVAADNLGL